MILAVYRCKMCGGTLEINSESVATCEYCGTQQTFSKTNDELMQNLFNRANNLRLKGEFDKAEQIYEKILQENSAEAEAYWGIVLCKYGIEYVEDPKTYTRIPTCHRTSYEAVTTDANYLAAITHADAAQRSIYEAEAKAIDAIQKDILSIVKNEKPFDVFICYKESDETGKRTPDSVIANDIYHQLTQEGLKVFYAAITLEDKLGQAYEPYIFAALSSAKVMLVIGTKPQYFTAVWVKNEWSRFLKLMKTDRSKLLIPCYKDMDAYDLPEEFNHLQAQDMGKIGFINDVVRGIRKVTSMEAQKAAATVQAPSNANTAPLLQRAFMFLEDGDWQSADEYCEKVLDLEPQNAQAYLGKLMAQLRVSQMEELRDEYEPFDDNGNYRKILRFGDEDLKNALTGYITYINERNETARKDGIYAQANAAMAEAKTESAYLAAAKIYRSITGYKDADTLSERCVELAEVARKDGIYADACFNMKQNTIDSYTKAISLFESIPGWKDADGQIAVCRQQIDAIIAKQKAEQLERERVAEQERLEQERKAEQERLEQERKAEQERLERERKAEAARQAAAARAKRNKKIAIIASSIVCAVLVVLIILNTVTKSKQYRDAIVLMDAGKYTEAFALFSQLDGYKDSELHYQTLWNQLSADWSQLAVRKTIDTGLAHSVGLKTDGTVVAVGSNSDGQCDVSGWTDIVAISAGDYHTVGLKADGTVVAIGRNDDGRCDISDWKDIVAISAGAWHTVGLKADGTVVTTGYSGNGARHQISGWTDIVAISASDRHTVGLKADGTVVAVGSNCDVSGRKDIVAISAGGSHTVGLKADGTVVAVGSNYYGQCEVSGWTDIVAISAGDYHTVGLKADGTVVATKYTGDYYHGQCDVGGWKDIVAISAGDDHTVGLKADGTVVAVGYHFDVSDWKDIKLP